MQNAKFNSEQISYVSFFPTGKNWETETQLKEKIFIENIEIFVEKYKQRPGLLLIEQKGKKRAFSQCFWLEPGDEIPQPEPIKVEEPTNEILKSEQITIEEPTGEILEKMYENNHDIILVQPKSKSRKKR